MSLLNKNEREELLRYARDIIAWKLGLRDAEPRTDYKGDHCGAFVTIHKGGNLRGCIGNIIADRPIRETIREMAEAAAFRDPRFMAMRPEEFDKISLEISILSPLKIVENTEHIETGRDGLYVTNGYHSGLLLPQVAPEQGWDRETFIDHTFLKAGLDPEYRKDRNTKIYSFTAEVFSE